VVAARNVSSLRAQGEASFVAAQLKGAFLFIQLFFCSKLNYRKN